MKCPNCNFELDDKQIAQHLASKGGFKTAQNMTKQQRIDRARKAGKANANKSLTRQSGKSII